MPKHSYNYFDKVFHKLALNYNTIAELSFVLDQKLVQPMQDELTSNCHVFVSGLARSGTTVLMRKFYATGSFQSLTYRDMPFVLAPNIWRQVSSLSNRQLKSSVRAHGDELHIDLDSPECFDEVFWRVFSREDYLLEHSMIPHTPSKQLIQKYIQYINAVMQASGARSKRYLSKNNNNILRIAAIREAFPNSVILVPYREPMQHANSLLNQHLNFCKLQTHDKFTLSYMTWLGHHEFGLDHRPFQFQQITDTLYPPDSLNYWLELWYQTYSWLEKNYSKSVIFLCYEDLCTDANVWRALVKVAQCNSNHEVGDIFTLSKKEVNGKFDEELYENSMALYKRLTNFARNKLSIT